MGVRRSLFPRIGLEPGSVPMKYKKRGDEIQERGRWLTT